MNCSQTIWKELKSKRRKSRNLQECPTNYSKFSPGITHSWYNCKLQSDYSCKLARSFKKIPKQSEKN